MTTPLEFAEMRITHRQLSLVGRTACKPGHDRCYLDDLDDEPKVYQCARCNRCIAWCFGADDDGLLVCDDCYCQTSPRREPNLESTAAWARKLMHLRTVF